MSTVCGNARRCDGDDEELEAERREDRGLAPQFDVAQLGQAAAESDDEEGGEREPGEDDHCVTLRSGTAGLAHRELREPFGDVRTGSGLGDPVALCALAAELREAGEHCLALDTLCDRADAQLRGELDRWT